ncbi:DUF4326 domain-containing protein [Flavilitoribacter nigricans]|uniref:DUF4326 domain-containing protein n=1 Tax=Flavilitoribacter nigricans (strain ATCC 23147 / DSM 23189 / NBRC 102662 / NCIMB 1420 / SS-2) TaxID=1122177 RepID=A0A2D0NF31_FLAN2|nr:DUF4326 domain-containing protein [Flavilitoribacter nigricans]PHN06966.1 hypothetical protein CRP01_09120 [Flavilitoribacter nigricans DSM 23189 = NBRC 102662]
MNTPKRIQRKRVRGWKMPANAVSVTRPGRFGNPFPAEKFGRERSIEMFRDLLNGKWYSDMHPYGNEYINKHGLPSHKLIKAFLGGKDLACWCKEGDPCHADVLIEIANS